MSKETDELFDDEVTTGATLSGGTTVGGNTVYHLGNDGAGSGLDAETLDGNIPASLNDIYDRTIDITNTNNSGSVIDTFDPNSSDPYGAGIDNNGCIWHTDRGQDSKRVKKFDTSGNELLDTAAPNDDPKGIDGSPSNSIWNADAYNGTIYELDQSASVISNISSPSDRPTGLGIDDSGVIWNADEGSNCIYQLDSSGTVFAQFSTPSSSAQGVGVDISSCIWHTDLNADSIYKLNKNGSVQRKFPSPDVGPADIVPDENHSLWHADGSYNAGSGALIYLDSGEKFNGFKLKEL